MREMAAINKDPSFLAVPSQVHFFSRFYHAVIDIVRAPLVVRFDHVFADKVLQLVCVVVHGFSSGGCHGGGGTGCGADPHAAGPGVEAVVDIVGEAAETCDGAVLASGGW
eukprot:CAMPEP_0202441332 /NCGR_PEP_ID=MMETSP1360-20130828/816_1 /ASSEMBLY_ACC=CAM_ASM_000848 /TAXON_ID=515479 /ORGANISM="Licmophora paradoxa, Strain CCMP2313" /LENGTH=109 /DNA_ID=CAMNT_0049056267 /DNA_START=112 /DNA_END=438 /DNA_ORIENTATION=-